MESTNGKQPKPFRISMIGRAETEFLAICAESVGHALDDTVVQSMAEILTRLTKDPRDFGEPLFRLKKLQMMVRCAAISPLHIEYGVHESEPVVVIRKVRWLVDPAAP